MTFRENANGTVTVTTHRHPITIAAWEVRMGKLFSKNGPWEPKPSECWECKAPAMYRTKSEPRGEELLLVHFRCGECGMHEVEPLD